MATTKPFFTTYLHIVSALFRLREGADRGVDVWFWCDRTGEFGVQVNEGPIAEALVDGLSFRSIGR